MAAKIVAKKNSAPKQSSSYSVYVVELCAKSLGQDPETNCVYVGQTSDKPIDRFLAHKRGGLFANEQVRDHGLRLRPDLCDGWPHANLTEHESYAGEWRLAKDLKTRDYQVWGGQGLPYQYVRKTLKAKLHAGQELKKLTGHATFTIIGFEHDALVLAIGPAKNRTEIPWAALEGIPAFLREQWCRLLPEPNTPNGRALDKHLRRHVLTKSAPWVGAVLEAAGVIEISTEAPIHVRFIRPFI